MIDQTRLPHETAYVTCRNYRGSGRRNPRHGYSWRAGDRRSRCHGRCAGALDRKSRSDMPVICDTLRNTRPTAVNLFWAIDRMKGRVWLG